MAQARINWPDLGSPLRHYPDYVLQIGLITIEITNLEVMLGDLLGALLDFDDDASHGIYFTPRAAIARMDVVVNVAESPRFDEHPNLRTSVVKIADRAKALMGQRHDIIHAHWVASDDGKMVGRLRPPFSSDLRREIIALRVLKKLVADIRALIKEARFAMDEIYETLRPDTWPQIRASVEQTAEELRQGNLRQEALFRARSAPRLRQQLKRSVVARRADTWVQVPRTDTLNC